MANQHEVSFAESLRAFGKIGLLSFGGPAAQISLMHKVLVDEKKWLSEQQYLNALSFCMLLPGPEAMQLATYAGWRINGVIGGLLSGLLFVLPGAVVIFALAMLYALYGDLPLMSMLFLGIKAAVLVVVLEALLKVSRRALKEPVHWVIAGLAFIGIFFLALPFPLIVLAAAIYGAVFGKNWGGVPEPAPPVTTSFQTTLGVIGIWLAVWLLPLALLWAVAPALITDIAVFFSKLAIVTFGGAYAVLAYMAQDVVTGFGWLTAEEMMDGLGLAETTPGPLILVTQFVGFLAAYNESGIALAFLAGLVTLWVTFVPCFLWIFAGAPYIDWISAQPRLTGALSGITAAVVGVILNLSIWFGLHVLFAEVTHTNWGPLTLWLPEIATLNWRVVLLTVLCAVLLLWRHMPLGWVLALSALGGYSLSLIA